MKQHNERKHSKFSASGAERWFKCPGSVQLSEGIPDRDNKWSIEGTRGHEVLEATLRAMLAGEPIPRFKPPYTREMATLAKEAAKFVLAVLRSSQPYSKVISETRIGLPFINKEMFGTFDIAVIEHFGTLHVFDYKFGRHLVSPRRNLQMIFYALGLAARHHWNFKRVRLWIIQPRVSGYDGPVFWEIGILELKKYVRQFEKAVKRALNETSTFVEGPHCHWCKAVGKCPLKNQGRTKKGVDLFSNLPLKKGR